MTPLADKALRILAATAIMSAVSWLDYRTGDQIGLLVLYALPVAWIAWSVNFTWAFLLGALNTAGRIWADARWLHHFSHAWIPWERGCMRTIVLSFIAFSFHQFRRDLDTKSLKLRQLEGILPVCIACNRISDPAGRWLDLESYLRRNSEAKPDARLCPECSAIRYQ